MKKYWGKKEFTFAPPERTVRAQKVTCATAKAKINM